MERGTNETGNAERGTRNSRARSVWDPAELHYPWLEGVPSLGRPFLPSDYGAATGEIPIARVVFVECNCPPEEAGREVAFVERLAQGEPRLTGIVAFANLADSETIDRQLDALSVCHSVKGIRQNIQGQPAGFCRRHAFVEGVRKVGRRELVFDLCATHDQLREVADLVRDCPDTRFVLDHCGKPAIRDRCFEPWSAALARLAAHKNVCCKLSGLLTEAGERWRPEDLLPYATRVVECFGPERVLYASDWPVLTLAGDYRDWYGFTERVTQGWSATDRSRFYGDNAARVYGL
ncbi:MAG: amidohydrolase [Gemmatimonadetes bacterium]|nr:MAG: amidohydrolase [Gemmatimonadota bacterium]